MGLGSTYLKSPWVCTFSHVMKKVSQRTKMVFIKVDEREGKKRLLKERWEREEKKLWKHQVRLHVLEEVFLWPVTFACLRDQQARGLVSVSALLLWTAAAKLLQSCPTLLHPTDGSPPGSPVPGILQARTLEWATVSFSGPAQLNSTETCQGARCGRVCQI